MYYLLVIVLFNPLWKGNNRGVIVLHFFSKLVMLFLYLETESRAYHSCNYQHGLVTVTHHICPVPHSLPVTVSDGNGHWCIAWEHRSLPNHLRSAGTSLPSGNSTPFPIALEEHEWLGAGKQASGKPQGSHPTRTTRLVWNSYLQASLQRKTRSRKGCLKKVRRRLSPT